MEKSHQNSHSRYCPRNSERKMREKKRRQRQRKKEEIGTNLKDEWCENSVHFFKLQALTVYLYDTKKEMEKEMATHSSIFAWRIPWTEEPIHVLLSMGSHRIGHN